MSPWRAATLAVSSAAPGSNESPSLGSAAAPRVTHPMQSLLPGRARGLQSGHNHSASISEVNFVQKEPLC